MTGNAAVRGTLRQLRRPVRASVGFTLVGVVSRALVMLSVPIFTRLLTPSEYGLFAVYSARLSLVSVLATWNLSGGIVYRGMQRAGPAGRDRFVLRAMLATAVPFSACAVLLLVGGEAALGVSPALVWVMLGQIGASTVVSFFAASCRYTYRPLPYALVQLPMAVLTPLLGVVLTVGGLGALGRVIAPLPVTLAGAAVALVLMVRTARTSTALPLGADVPRLLREGLFLLPYTLSLVAVDELGRLLLDALVGTAAVGAYGIAHALGGAPLLLLYGINGALQPWVLRRMATGDLALIRRVLWLLSVALGAAALSVALLSPELLALLAPAAYAPAARAVAPVALAVVPHAWFLTLTGVGLYRERAGRMMLGTVTVATGTAALGYLLIRRAGVIGAGWLLPIAYTALAVAALFTVRVRGERLPVRPWASALLLGVLALLAAPLPALAAARPVRLLLLLLLLVGCGGYLYRSRSLLLDVPRAAASD